MIPRLLVRLRKIARSPRKMFSKTAFLCRRTRFSNRRCRRSKKKPPKSISSCSMVFVFVSDMLKRVISFALAMTPIFTSTQNSRTIAVRQAYRWMQSPSRQKTRLAAASAIATSRCELEGDRARRGQSRQDGYRDLVAKQTLAQGKKRVLLSLR